MGKVKITIGKKEEMVGGRRNGDGIGDAMEFEVNFDVKIHGSLVGRDGG